MTDSFISTSDAAKRLGITQRTLYRKIASGDLPAYRIGQHGGIRVKVSDLDTLMIPVRVTVR